MSPRWVVDTPARLVEVCRLEGVVVIRRIGGVWYAGLPWANKGRGRVRAYSSWSEAMRAVPHEDYMQLRREMDMQRSGMSREGQ